MVQMRSILRSRTTPGPRYLDDPPGRGIGFACRLGRRITAAVKEAFRMER